MTLIDATNLDYEVLNKSLREIIDDCFVTGCCGQRFIATGMPAGFISINEIPENVLGAYLNGATITIHANEQDAVGDTMNNEKIIIHGDIDDAAGYTMRGGKSISREIKESRYSHEIFKARSHTICRGRRCKVYSSCLL